MKQQGLIRTESGLETNRNRLPKGRAPAFAYGRTDELLPPSISRPLHENNEDWRFYYVNMFVDRDMFMCFHGGGVGHKSTHNATQIFRDNCDPLDCVAPGGNADSEQASDSEEDEEGFEGDEEGSEGDEAVSAGDEEASEGDEGGPSESAINEGIVDQDKDKVGESEMEEYDYGGLDQEDENTDTDQDDSSSDNEDNDLGPEDGEDKNEEELEGYGEL